MLSMMIIDAMFACYYLTIRTIKRRDKIICEKICDTFSFEIDMNILNIQLREVQKGSVVAA